MEGARSEDLLWHCNRVWQSRRGHSCQFWCWSSEPRPTVEQALVEDPLGSPPWPFLLLLFHIYNKVTAFYLTDIHLLCISGKATSSVTYIRSDVTYYLCRIFLQELLSIPKKCALVPSLAPAPSYPPQASFIQVAVGTSRNIPRIYSKHCHMHNKPRGLIFWGV